MIDIAIKKENFYNLNQVSSNERNVIGSKASMLGTLGTLGIPVPQGYAIAFSVFDHFISGNKIQIDEQRCFAESEQVREQILSGEFSVEVANELMEMYERVSMDGKKLIVVRSSASVEDSSHNSMAGVFESFLYISSFEMFIDSIKKCYASLFREQALHILFLKNIAIEKLKMGVIVQELIDGHFSGIAFTADVTSMFENSVRIQAVNGGCDNFVSRREKYSDYTIEKVTAKKSARCPEGTPLLDDVTLDKVFNMALSIELYFASPQDIEWTMRDGELFILQTRPITTIKQSIFPVQWKNSEDAHRTWHKIYDEPIKPFLQDVYIQAGDQMAEGSLDTLISLHSYGEIQEHNGYLFFSRKSIGMNVPQINTLRNEKIEKIWKRFEKGETVFYDDVLPKLLFLLDQVKSLSNQSQLSDKDVLQLLDAGLEYCILTRKWHWPLRLAHECIDEFYRYCCTLKTDLRYEDYIDLLYQNSIFTNIRERCITMAGIVKASPELSHLFSSCIYDEMVLARLQNEPKAGELMNLIEEFLDDYGLQVIDDKRLIGATINEQPHHIVSLIRSALHINSEDFALNRESMFKNKIKLTEELISKISDDSKKEFLLKLKTAEKSLLSVDNNNHYLVKLGFGPLRLALGTAGKWLRQEGLLKLQDDVYFLKYNELKEMINSKDQFLFVNKVGIRKELFERQKRLSPPQTIGKSPSLIKKRRFGFPKLWRKKVHVLKGLSGLAVKTNGIIHKGFQYTGIVRNEFMNTVNENSILIINYAHSGEDILPFLQKIKGVIYAWGSPYDHPGIMARELGIPVLYNVNINALNEGDEVELDGILGQVRILKRAGKTNTKLARR